MSCMNEYEKYKRNPNITFMTQATQERLQRELNEARQKATEQESNLGATQDSAQDWHDNPAYDYLVQQVQQQWSKVQRLEAALRDIQIIPPRQETDNVDIGNTVEVLYEGQTDSEQFTILGREDAYTEKTWISCESPLGQALIEKSVGEIIKLSNGMEVKLLNIFPGQFSGGGEINEPKEVSESQSG